MGEHTAYRLTRVARKRAAKQLLKSHLSLFFSPDRFWEFVGLLVCFVLIWKLGFIGPY